MRQQRTIETDDRGIEGLPIRLVIALVVGVAALALMMNMLSGLGGIQPTKVSADFQAGPVVNATGEDITLKVVDDNGEPVQNATVILEDGTASLTTPHYGESNATGHVTFNLQSSDVNFRSDQDRGTLKVDIKPPGDGKYQVRSNINDITVFENS